MDGPNHPLRHKFDQAPEDKKNGEAVETDEMSVEIFKYAGDETNDRL